MDARRLMVAWAGACALVLLFGSSAHALTKDEQKCIDGYNNKLRLVSAQAGKSARACIKNAGKGKEAAPNTCIVSNPDGKIAGKEAGVTALFAPGGKCTGSEPIQQGAATGNAAHRDAITDLAQMIFGDPVSGVITPGKDEAKCQDKAIQRATQAFTEKMKGFRKCKKDKMKLGTVSDEATLTTQCMTPSIPDPAGKILKKVNKLLDDVNANCGGLPLTALFPGVATPACTGTTNALGGCIETLVECKVCLALNAADGTNRDCDAFDDGLANGSCGIVQHKCVLDTTNCSPATNPLCGSKILIHLAALPVPLVFGLVGALDLGTAGPVAACSIQMLSPINIPSIGFVCLSAGDPCPNGVRWCGPGGGPALGVDFQSDGNIGACTSNAACQTACATSCGVGKTALGQCTGFCTAGDQSACTSDAACLTPPKGGACNGPDPIGGSGNICQCNCINAAAHGPSDPGDFLCQLSQHLVVESSLPCDGVGVIVDAGSTCLPVTTERSTGLITDANFSPGSVVPPVPNVNDLSGVGIPCATADTSVTTGIRGVGAVNFFGSALGDLSVGLQSTCQ